MKDIDDIINEMKIDDLKDLKFSYSDIISIEQGVIDEDHFNYWVWKYYTGDITIDEHNGIKETLQEYMVYKVYTIIFSIKQSQNWYEEILNCLNKQDYVCLSNEVTDLWLMRPENFQYEEEFKKFIFMLYLVKKEERFRQIALDFYKSNEDVKKYIERCNDYKHMFLMYRKGDCNYKKYYAIEECKSEECNCSTDNKNDEKNNNQNEDWITKRFGGAK